MTILDECIEALGDKCKILSQQQTQQIFEQIQNHYPFTSWGRIDWDKVERKKNIELSDDILRCIKKYLNEVDIPVYVMWDEATLPALESSLVKVIEFIDDVTVVSFDTWIYLIDPNYILEFYHENEITLGFLD